MPTKPKSKGEKLRKHESQIFAEHLTPLQLALVPIPYIFLLVTLALNWWLLAAFKSSMPPHPTIAQLKTLFEAQSKVIYHLTLIDGGVITGVLAFLTGKSYANKVKKE